MAGKHLTKSEVEFLSFYIKYGDKSKAYRLTKPGVTDQSAMAAGSRMYKRIMKKVGWEEKLGSSPLDEGRILHELDQKLQAKKKVFFPGIEPKVKENGAIEVRSATVDDNKTQMEALKLLVELHGKRKQSIKQEIDQTDRIVIQAVRIEKPDDAGTGEHDTDV